jgi:hypothetical protein
LICLVLGVGKEVQAQTPTDSSGLRSQSIIGGTDGITSSQKLIRGSQNTEVLRHRDLNGKPCLDIGGFARPLSSSSKLLDHVIVANNSCADLIRVEICYLGSLQCSSVQVPGHTRKEFVLGTTVIKDFQYEFRERF